LHTYAAIPLNCVVLGGRASKLLVTGDRAMALLNEFTNKKVVPSHRGIATCTTPALFLKHSDETFATYV
jgi:hypothetical protein